MEENQRIQSDKSQMIQDLVDARSTVKELGRTHAKIQVLSIINYTKMNFFKELKTMNVIEFYLSFHSFSEICPTKLCP